MKIERDFCDIEQKAGPPDLEPVSPELVDEYRKRTYLSYENYLRDWLLKLDATRSSLWRRNYTNPDAYEQSVEPMREHFKEMLGFWSEPNQRQPIEPQDEKLFLETDRAIFSRFRYEIMPSLFTYAIRIVPKTPAPHPALLIQHGYLGTPELACGLATTSNQQEVSYRSFGLRAAQKHGFHVVAPHHPSGYGTLNDETNEPLPHFKDHDCHYGKNRLHRMCVMGGTTLLGLDVLASSRAVDLLSANEYVDKERIGMYGLSRGGQVAMYLPALDRRIKASVCSAYFSTRMANLIGPCSRTTFLDWFSEGQILPDQVKYFADSDVVSLIAPRAFAIEAGILDESVDCNDSKKEFQLARSHYEKLGIVDRITFIPHGEGHVSATIKAFEFLKEKLS